MSEYRRLPGEEEETHLRLEVERGQNSSGGRSTSIEEQINANGAEAGNDEGYIRLEDVYVNNWLADDSSEVQPVLSDKSGYQSKWNRGSRKLESGASGENSSRENLSEVIDLDSSVWVSNHLSTGKLFLYRLTTFWKSLLSATDEESGASRQASHYCVMFSLLLLLAFAVLGLPVILHKISPNAPQPPGLIQDDLNTAILVSGAQGAVAADNAECSKLGVRVLRDLQGNAVDAAVATTLCQGVLNPFASSIGGGCFILVRLANGTEDFLDGREVAPAASTKEMFFDSNTSVVGGKAVANLLIGCMEMELNVDLALSSKVGPLLARRLEENKEIIYDSPSLRELFTKMVSSANTEREDEEDFFIRDEKRPTSIVCSGLSRRLEDSFSKEDFNSSEYTGEDEKLVLLEENDNWSQTALSRTLQLVADKGADALYIDLAKNLSEDIIRVGGILTETDLRDYQVIRRTPLHFKYNDLELISVPPPSSGGATLGLILNILKLATLNSIGRNGKSYHYLTEAYKFGFGERMQLGDPAFVNGTDEQVRKMLNESFAQELFSRIEEDRTFPSIYYTDTQRLLNEEGNAVAITSTVNLPFGARFVSSSTGILLNNEMDDFSTGNKSNAFGLTPAQANEVEPGKRPLSSMTPLIVLKNGMLYMILGGSGGPRIISATTQVFLNIAVFGDDPAKAVAAPRLHHQLYPNVVFLESVNDSSCSMIDTFSYSTQSQSKPDWSYWSEVCKELKETGHNVSSPSEDGVVQIILSDISKNGNKRNLAVSDPRKWGKAAAY
eukprot:jgi/Galph1/880/GphlegSOOS_G5702.1